MDGTEKSITRLVLPGREEEISVLRLDLPDPVSGGNKFFKLKYNLTAMREEGKEHLLTFGGAFSNHIAAVAAAGKREKIKTTGIIRGEELNIHSNEVLRFASSCGMQLRFISRGDYRRREDPAFLAALKKQFDDPYMLPEGGSNAMAVKGCAEILSARTSSFDAIFCPVGTGATLAGIISSAGKHQEIFGIAVLNGRSYLEEEVKKFLGERSVAARWRIVHDYTAGGYARSSQGLEKFVHESSRTNALPLDHVYSGKALYAMHEMVKGDAFRGKQLLFVHTGGYAFTASQR
ncbi:MAG TPA: pyridoxal-phosphate dependent enzyme [Bacteroidia bacterium]|nr:pyridoxal-phosphate dependent enzyme [Bacteroidia bacterium]